MPREIVHWLVLERASKALAETPGSTIPGWEEISASAEAMACLRLGAVAHDAPYYYRFGGSPFEEIAAALHGEEGEDTYAPLREAAGKITGAARSRAELSALKSLLLGMLSHAATDIVFHPLVFYFTGNYHAEDAHQRKFARARHRLFELYLDHAYAGRLENTHRGNLRTILRACGKSLEPVNRFLDDAVVPAAARTYRLAAGKDLVLPQTRHTPPAYFIDAFSTMALCQSAFEFAPLGAIVRAVSRLPGQPLLSLDGLFTFGRAGYIQAFERPLEFRNPVTGEMRSATTDTLLTESADLCLTLWKAFAPCFAGAAAVELPGNLIASSVGPSLNFGVPNAPSKRAQYFSPSGFPLPGLAF